MHPTSTPVASARLGWADTAKGLCIGLVVLHHLVVKHYGLTLTPDSTVLQETWIQVDAALKPLRMPLFFLLSGIFASGALNRPWADVVRKRVATPYYTYVVWLLLQTAFFAVVTGLTMNRTTSVGELVSELVVASTGVWYLYALALYFVLARALRKLDLRWVLGVAAIVSAGASTLPLEHINHTSLIQHFVYFAAGAYLPSIGARLAALGSKRHLPVLAVVYLAAYGGLLWLDLPLSAMTLLVSPLALLLAVRIAMAVAFIPGVGRATAAVGRRTLPVYVLHMPVLAVLHLALGRLDLDGVPVAVLAVYPAVMVVVLVALCLQLQSLLERASLGFLFRLPTLPQRYPRTLRRPVPGLPRKDGLLHLARSN